MRWSGPGRARRPAVPLPLAYTRMRQGSPAAAAGTPAPLGLPDDVPQRRVHRRPDTAWPRAHLPAVRCSTSKGFLPSSAGRTTARRSASSPAVVATPRQTRRCLHRCTPAPTPWSSPDDHVPVAVRPLFFGLEQVGEQRHLTSVMRMSSRATPSRGADEGLLVMWPPVACALTLTRPIAIGARPLLQRSTEPPRWRRDGSGWSLPLSRRRPPPARLPGESLPPCSRRWPRPSRRCRTPCRDRRRCG